MIKITKAKRTITFGNYENISLECEMDAGETAEEAVKHLEDKINKIINNKANVANIRCDIQTLEIRKEDLEREVLNMQKKKDEIIAWKEKYNLSDEAIGEMPF